MWVATLDVGSESTFDLSLVQTLCDTETSYQVCDLCSGVVIQALVGPHTECVCVCISVGIQCVYMCR